MVRKKVFLKQLLSLQSGYIHGRMYKDGEKEFIPVTCNMSTDCEGNIRFEIENDRNTGEKPQILKMPVDDYYKWCELILANIRDD